MAGTWDVTSIIIDVPTQQNASQIYKYEVPVRERIMQMGMEEEKEQTKPFLQRIQLKGPQNVIVRATGQVDDGTSKNCISKNRWDRYGHCLSPLEPSNMLIKVTNDTQIRSMGRWHGGITVGGMEMQSMFEDGRWRVPLRQSRSRRVL
jgi:hypothetical protein